MSDLIRYTARELTVKAKQTFRSIQRERPDGGEKTDYHYKGWSLVLNEKREAMQLVNYDVRRETEILKRATANVL